MYTLVPRVQANQPNKRRVVLMLSQPFMGKAFFYLLSENITAYYNITWTQLCDNIVCDTIIWLWYTGLYFVIAMLRYLL